MSRRSYSIEDIESLFMQFGNRPHDSGLQERVSVLEHALQCAQQAEWADANESLVGAAFLQNLGHLLAPPGPDDSLIGDAHEALAVPFLEENFSEAVLGPIRQLSAARRYLASTDPKYLQNLPAQVLRLLEQQGGPMSPTEVRQFETTPHAMDAVQLRRWSEQSQVPGQRTPPMDYYIALLEDLQRQSADSEKLEVGPQTVT